MSVPESVHDRAPGGIKRAVDIVVAASALVLLLPLLLILALLLRFTGEGKVFFRQTRVGFQGRPFALLKFATMLENSARMPGGDITLDNDPRILPLGHFLRKSKLNELPQLWNVLVGDMSLIGPRPIDPPNFVLYPSAGRAAIESLRPGLTGIGSLVFRDESVLVAQSGVDPQHFYETYIYPDKSALETWYAHHQSLVLDLKLLVLTAAAVIHPRATLAQRFFPDLPRLSSRRAASGFKETRHEQ